MPLLSCDKRQRLFGRQGNFGGIRGFGLCFLEKDSDGIEERGCAGGGLLHDVAPDAFGTVHERDGFGEMARRGLQQRTQMAGDDARLVLAALELVEENAEDVIQGVGIESVAATLEVFAFAQELAAEGEAVEVLVVGEFAWRNGFQFGERF